MPRIAALVIATASLSAVAELAAGQDGAYDPVHAMLEFSVRDEDMAAATLQQYKENRDALLDDSMSMTEALTWLEDSGALELSSVFRDIERIELWTECKPINFSSIFFGMSDDLIGLSENDFDLVVEGRLRAVGLYPQYESTEEYSRMQAALENELPSLEINVSTEVRFSPLDQIADQDRIHMEMNFSKPVIDIVTGLGTWAITWEQDSGLLTVDLLPSALFEAVDEFITEYLDVNEQACR